MTNAQQTASVLPSNAIPVSLPAMQQVTSARTAGTLAVVLVFLLISGSLALIFTPWQQSVSGMGRVAALTPVERQQNIAAPVDGRVVKWHVIEGTKVRAGDPIVEIADNDPQILERLAAERSATEDRRVNAASRVAAIEERIVRLEESKTNAVSAARSRVQMAAERIRQSDQALAAANERLVTARLNLDRQKKMLDRGITAVRTLELAQLEFATAEAEVRRSEAALSAAKAERLALEDDLRKVETDANAAIQDARASLNMALGDVNNIRAELQRIDVRVARQRTQNILAPRDGTILRLLAQPGSELLKAGEPVAIFVPEAHTPMVELWLDGLDMPLVHPGDPVRLQFNGWPAIQFVGWPSVAVGTFGGRVHLVDATDNGNGKFRILVIPDPNDQPWPSATYLRQGVQAKGWVLLRNVALGWELWRRFNGFPPVIAADEPGASGKVPKAGKK